MPYYNQLPPSPIDLENACVAMPMWCRPLVPVNAMASARRWHFLVTRRPQMRGAAVSRFGWAPYYRLPVSSWSALPEAGWTCLPMLPGACCCCLQRPSPRYPTGLPELRREGCLEMPSPWHPSGLLVLRREGCLEMPSPWHPSGLLVLRCEGCLDGCLARPVPWRPTGLLLLCREVCL